MTSTDDLIAALAAGGAMPERHANWRFLAPMAAVTLGCIAATALLLGALFPVANAYESAAIVGKWIFSVPLLLLAVLALFTLGKPGRTTRVSLAALALPFAYIAVLGLPSLFSAPQSFPGEAWNRCLLAMSIMSPIGFAAAVVAMRRLAPTNLRRAGFVAGLFGGAVAMTAYTPFCPGRGMLYFVLYYFTPILLMAAIGWLAGPRLLRW